MTQDKQTERIQNKQRIGHKTKQTENMTQDKTNREYDTRQTNREYDTRQTNRI